MRHCVFEYFEVDYDPELPDLDDFWDKPLPDDSDFGDSDTPVVIPNIAKTGDRFYK